MFASSRVSFLGGSCSHRFAHEVSGHGYCDLRPLKIFIHRVLVVLPRLVSENEIGMA